ncbi:unnamed protein product [Toxocara canis]|uniref:PRKCSH_1 domain-containing protein n=1 Tax=Toxocara canis TaxID=6265 RepID=A0A183UHT2_TOXCA|nr:unnamed protein product [Toxocara canis]
MMSLGFNKFDKSCELDDDFDKIESCGPGPLYRVLGTDFTERLHCDDECGALDEPRESSIAEHLTMNIGPSTNLENPV